MRRRFTIKPLFCDITNLIFWYHKFDFVISKKYFVISQNRFCDIKKWISWYQRSDLVISQNRICDIKKALCVFDITKSNYKIDFLISQNHFAFLIWKSWFCGIIKWNFWYQKIDFVISQNQIYFFLILQNRICDIKRRFCDTTKSLWFCDIKKSILWYHNNSNILVLWKNDSSRK